MQNQIQILTKDLAKAHEQMASQATAATPTAAFAAPPSNEVAAAKPPPATSPPASLPSPAPTATPLPPLATAQPPLATAQPPLYPPPRAALHTLIMARRGPISALPVGSQIGDLLDVSSVMKRVTSPTAALPVQSCSACCGSRPRKPLKAHPGDKSLSSPPRKVAKALPRGF